MSLFLKNHFLKQIHILHFQERMNFDYRTNICMHCYCRDNKIDLL